MLEEWRDIPGYEGLYQVSDMGRIKGLKRGKILKGALDSAGYRFVSLCCNSCTNVKLVHHLVALTFIPNPEKKPFIDHINTIRDDNRVKNLRWVTPKENMNNSITLKKLRVPKGVAYTGKPRGGKRPGAGRKLGSKTSNNTSYFCARCTEKEKQLLREFLETLRQQK